MAIKKVSKYRWDIAQNSEKGYWEQFNDKSLLGYLEKPYSKRARELLLEWKPFIEIGKDTKVLQIGSGPLDIINYLKINHKYSIDPLADFFKERFKGIDYESTNLQKGVGEDIPFPDKYFDIAIISNVLDHTHNPEKVLLEMNRVLKDNGILHLEIQVYQKSFLVMARILDRVKRIFKGEIFNIHHPHMFLISEVEKIISRNFRIAVKKHQDFQELKKERKKEKFTRSIP